MSKKLHDFTVKNAKSQDHNLDQYKGKVVLIVNVASQCGFTPQYKGLEDLYLKFKNDGLVVLGFPCNQFGAQEPGSDSEIQSFCQLNFGVTFPIMSKVDVNGAKAEPTFQFLKENAKGILGTELIKWNFTKFLIGRDGEVINRYAPNAEPHDLAKDIKKALGL